MDDFSDSDEEPAIDFTVSATKLNTSGDARNDVSDRHNVLIHSPLSNNNQDRRNIKNKKGGANRSNHMQTRPPQVDLSSVWPGNLEMGGDDTAGDAVAAMFSSASMPILNNSDNYHKSRNNSNVNIKNSQISNQSNQSGGYRLEATKGMYTVESKDHTWQRMGKVESPKERPATRREILALHAYFSVAMDFADRNLRRNNTPGSASGGGRAAIASLQSSSEMEMEQDALTVKEDVRQLFATFEDLAVAASSHNNNNSNNSDEQSRSGADNPAMTMSSAQVTAHRTILTSAFFEHKWSDLVFGQVVSQISINCHEHGQLLRHVRRHLAGCFSSLKEVHIKTLQQLQGASKVAESFSTELNTLRMQQETVMRQLEVTKDRELKQEKLRAQEKYDEYEEQLRQADTAHIKMEDTLATLNNIFRSMRDDAQNVRALDFVDTTSKLESKLQVCHKELTQLRPLRTRLKEAKEREERKEIETKLLQRKIMQLEDDVLQRDAMVQELMQHESTRLSIAEVRRASLNEDESSKDNSGRKSKAAKEDSATDTTSSANNTDSPGEMGTIGKDEEVRPKVTGKNLLKQEDTVYVPTFDEQAALPTESGVEEIRKGMDMASNGRGCSATVMCIRCNASLDEAGNIDHLIADQNNKVPCMGYRILLPNLMGYRPTRSRTWVLRVMRCIIRAKRLQDFRAERDSCTKMRFPEFVYAWFSPSNQVVTELSKEGRLRVHAQADENRWALYYGMKRLGDELPEARMFFGFLDEKHGEDELAFYLHLLAVMESEVNKRGETLEWGVCTDAISHEALARQLMDLNTPEEPEIDDFAWIQVKHAAEVVKLVMANSTPAEKQKTLKRLAACAIQQQTAVLQVHNSVNKMVDAHVCMRVLLKEFHEEQAHRRAALRLMFNTVAAAGAQEGGEDKKDKGVVNRSVDLQQLTSIIESLNPKALPWDAVQIYRMAHEHGRGQVTYESFTIAATRVNFFSRCLNLPVHYGAALANELTMLQCAQLGEVVRKHTALVGSMVDEFVDQYLNEQDSHILRGLNADVCHELSKGKLVLDGRRSLCALRRMLEFMLRRRADVHEQIGDTMDAERIVFMVDKELGALASCVSNFDHDERRKRLAALQEKNSASVIQRKWRNKHKDSPSIPATMRELLSVGFEPQVKILPPVAMRAPIAQQIADSQAGATTHDGADTGVGALVVAQVGPEGTAGDVISGGLGEVVQAQGTAVALPGSVPAVRRAPRSVVRPVEWVLLWLDEVYRYKMLADIAQAQRNYFLFAKGRINKPPITPADKLRNAPKMTLQHAVHEIAIRRFGIRSIAERQIHDFFINVHRHAKTHPRVRLFACFMGVRAACVRPRSKMLSSVAIEGIGQRTKTPPAGSASQGSSNGGANGPTDGAKVVVRKVAEPVKLGRLMLAEEPLSAELFSELCDPAAIDTYVTALSILQRGVGALFPDPDSSNSSFVALDVAIVSMKALFKGAAGSLKHRPCGAHPSHRSLEEALNCLERVEFKGKVDMDRFLMAVMQAWLVESRLREVQLDNIATTMRNKFPMDRVLSLPDFQEHLAPLLVSAPSTPETVLVLYEQVLKAVDPDLHISPDGLKRVTKLFRWSAEPDVKALRLPSDTSVPQDEWKLLEFSWNPYREVLADTIRQLLSMRNGSNDFDESDEGYFDFKDMQQAFMHTLEDIEKTRARGLKSLDHGVVAGAWSNIRDLLIKIHRVRVRVGHGNEPLEDAWDRNKNSSGGAGGESGSGKTKGAGKGKGGGKNGKSKRGKSTK